MKRNQSRDELPILILIAAMFVCGCALGKYVSSHLSGVGLEVVNKLTSNLLYSNELTFLERLYNSFVSTVKLPLLVFALGASVYGKYLIPVVFAAKGFLTAFFVGCLTIAFGNGSLLQIVMIELIPSLFTIPCMLLLSMKAYSGKKPSDRFSINSLESAGGLILLLPAIAADMLLGPILLKAISA